MTTPAVDPTIYSVSGNSGSRPGRGLIIAGAVLLTVSTIGFFVSMIVILPRFDFAGYERQIATEGPSSAVIPGEVQFRVLEPLTGEDAEVDVGVGFESGAVRGSRTCTVTEGDGEAVQMLSSGGLDTFIEPGLGSDTPDLLAKNLEPGEYRVECVSDEADPGSFFVSRTVSVGDLLGFVGPVFALLAASAACGLVFLIGTVLLIVGLVKRRRSNRPPGGPGYPQPVSGYQQPMPGYGQPMGGYQPPTGYGPPGARPPDQVTRPPDQSDWQPPPGSH